MPPPAHPATSIAERELIITRTVDFPPERLFQAWTDPKLIVQWFTPKPWSTVSAEVDVRPGGSSVITMRSPEGDEFPNRGIYLEVVPNKRLVFTDAYTAAWEPSDHPFMTGILTFDDLGNGKTQYTARVVHWTAEDCEKHKAMGFEAGWNQALDQLIELLSSN